MTHRATITLDKEAYAFLVATASDNRSGYINTLLKKEKDRLLDEAIMKANKEEASDAAYQEEITDWDDTITDGLNVPSA
jgi:predicted CopG family antitoxin